uniref:Uncharacterized protein LOC111132697 n=1 Tax=Crassostrea virginica TaxID=6565 RepID=A0A8B8E7W5_CRAVI|nr:uncharacterized protein LOC111132697 [Crassostrea virginica]
MRLLITFACFLNVQSFLWIPSNLHSENSTPKPYGEKKESYNPKDIPKTTDISVQGNAWKKQTENVDECVSQETKKDLETPCGNKVSTRPRLFDSDNMCHLKKTAYLLFQTIANTAYDDKSGIDDIQLSGLNENISLNDQPKELQTFLQIHFMYLSEAKTITSDMAYELDPLLFDHLLKYLLFELCHLDDGEPKDLPNQSTCLSQDLSTFLSQIKYIAERLYCNLHNMIELKECQEVGGDLVNVC